MLKLNHVNLTVSDVPGLSDFFVRGFAFRVTESRGNGRFAVLEGMDGFILSLMHGKDGTHTAYPPLFHLGFLLKEKKTVREVHRRICEAGYEVPEPAVLERGGEPTFGFYHKAPGGVVVEVSAAEGG